MNYRISSRRRTMWSAVIAASLFSTLALASPAIADDPTPDPATAAAVALSAPSVYPYKDSYRDTVSITATPSTSDGLASTATGTIVISHSTTVVKSWAITAAAPVTERWDGRVKSTIRAGHYTVTVTYTNADASTVTASAPITVSAKKAVAHTWVKKVTAWASHDSCSFSGAVGCEEWDFVSMVPVSHSGGVTRYTTKIVKGERLTGTSDDPLSGQASNSVALPSAVTRSAMAKFHVTAHLQVSGPSTRKYYLSSCERSVGTDDSELCDHTHTASHSGSVNSLNAYLTDDSTRAAWLATAYRKTIAKIDYYTVRVTYYTLA